MANCKKGDWAVVEKLIPATFNGCTAQLDIRGVVVRCVSECETVSPGSRWWVDPKPEWSLFVGGQVFHGRFSAIGDEYLRPLSDSDGEDEMLRIAEWRPSTLHAWDKFAEGVA